MLLLLACLDDTWTNSVLTSCPWAESNVGSVKPAVQCRLPFSTSLSRVAVLALMGNVTGWPMISPFKFALMVAMPASVQQISAG